GIRFLPAPGLKAKVNVPAQVLLTQTNPDRFHWLDNDIRNHKVLFLGENHWMKDVHQLLTDLVIHANTVDYFPLLVLEKPYSATAFINAYLEADSATATQYWPAVKPFFNS